MVIIRIIIFSCFLVCCSSSSNKKSDTHNITNQYDSNPTTYKYGYNFEKADATYVLDSKLSEVSSLAYDVNSNLFYTNDDERGYYYELNSEDFSIENSFKFSKKGDYESIEKVGDEMIICKSSGTLYFYNILTKETKTVKNEFSSKNDIEGLCLHSEKNMLLMACKGASLDEKKGNRESKSIYSFDLQTNQLNKEPFLTINIEELEGYVNLEYKNTSKSKLKSLVKKAHQFAPSGIAMHPVTKDYFITSARGSIVVLINSKKELKHVAFLNSKTIPQPEGITFDKENNLYVSTEGQGFSGKVFKFLSE